MTRAAVPASFLYLAATPKGGRTLGLRQARTERALADQLRRDRLVLLNSWKLPAWVAGSRGMTLRDHAALNDQLAQLLSRGVPLVEALEVVASSVSPAARSRVDRMRELVQSGASFADACRQVGSFDAVSIAVYRASERSGDLAGAARQLATTARRQLAVRGKAATLMIYPAIVLTISIAVSIFMLAVIVPRIGEAFEQMDGLRLPLFTQFVMGTGKFLQANLSLVLIAFLALAVGAIVLRRHLLGAAARLMRRLPLMKDLVLAQESARFFGIMSAMSHAGVPLADSLSTANEAISHPTLRKQLRRMQERLVAGGVLRNLIDDVAALPLATRRLLQAAERAGDLDTAFDALATDMADEVDRRSARLLAAFEPAMIIVMFLIIGSLLLSILIPLMSATTSMAG